ncbi:hypothetical protein FQA39_LY12998 [Lamprigera yunnana]|nr:hypothetical protein FQA39_LY12998 [Lamprigera yunnana]
MMAKLGAIGKVLGPKGLWPNPKTGTVTTDVAKAIDDVKKGKIEFRADKEGNIHVIIGKTSFTAEQLQLNYNAIFNEIKKAKPQTIKDSLFTRAVEQNNMSEITEYLTQQNVFIFSYDDSVAAAKLVADFAKENEKLILKAGIYEGKVMDTKAITEIASLPSKPDLYSMFASSLIYPLRQVMAAINAVADKQA